MLLVIVKLYWNLVHMSRKATIVIIFLVLVIAGLGYLLLRPGRNVEAPSGNQQTSTITPPPQPAIDRDGTYVTYTDGIIEQTPRRKLLFFHAPWCPQCRAIESDINREGVASGLNIIKVDYDSNQELRQKYGVTIQTTFVEVGDDGGLISKFVAYEQPTLKSVELNFLSK